MKRPLDRITEAYYDGMGEEFGKKVRERIHWICSQAKGEKILDVGCSQGITSILLAREGKKVLGIDLNGESIEFAQKSLEDESEITKKYVEFKIANFMDYDFKDEKFDSIILAEILEHITDPERFIKKTSKLLNENGRVIITVPFGVNDYFDHKKTYYLFDMYELLIKYYEISRIQILGRWIVFVCENNSKNLKQEIPKRYIKELEKAFYLIERENLSKITELTNMLNKIQKKLEDVDSENKNIVSENKKLTLNVNNLSEENKKLSIELEDYKKKLQELKKNSEAKERELIDKMKNLGEENNELLGERKYLRKINQKLKEDLLEHIKNEEDVLLKYRMLLSKYDKLNKNYINIKRKYDSLSNSKLGKLTLKYWRTRKRWKKW